MKEEIGRLYILLQLIAGLKSETPMSVSRLAKRFEVSERSIYRYLSLLTDCGFSVEKDSKNRYFLSSVKDLERYTAQFTPEEASLLKNAVLSISSHHPLRNILLKKLFLLSDLNEIAEILYEKTLGDNLNKLLHAIKDKKTVLLVNYHSLNSNVISDRKVEPTGFAYNMKYLLAYDVKKQETRQFKPERIGKVEILDKLFEFEHFHDSQTPDAFGMNGKPVFIADLQLSERAYLLLKEEFPVAAGSCKMINEQWILTIKVKGFEGIGRFCLGLPGEIKVLKPESLITFLEEKTRSYQYLKIN